MLLVSAQEGAAWNLYNVQGVFRGPDILLLLEISVGPEGFRDC